MSDSTSTSPDSNTTAGNNNNSPATQSSNSTSPPNAFGQQWTMQEVINEFTWKEWAHLPVMGLGGGIYCYINGKPFRVTAFWSGALTGVVFGWSAAYMWGWSRLREKKTIILPSTYQPAVNGKWFDPDKEAKEFLEKMKK